jgi:hypothetical protein
LVFTPFLGDVELKENSDSGSKRGVAVPDAKKTLTELLTDSEEVSELLQVYGIDPSEKKQTKQRLEQLLAQIGEEQLLASLFELASGFALMAQEIFDLVQEAEVGIQGQILLPTQGTPLALAALDSGWAFSSAAPIKTNIDERAHALIGRLSGIVETLDPNQLIRNATETHETSLGRSLSRSRDPEARILRQVLRRSAERTRDYEAFSEADRRGISTAVDALNEARGHLSGVPLPAGLKATLDELETRCQATLDAMAHAEAEEGEANPMVSALADEIQIASIRLRELAEEAAEVERAEGGFRDFLKSDFWFQRWRIYELWVLCRVFRTLQRVGGKVTFRRVINGIWHLKYGRDTEPIATCEIGGRHLDIYYQLYRTDEDASALPDEKTADMPDIAVFERTSEDTTGGDSESASLGRAVAVIDPKHGLSFNYKKVDEVLTRYAHQFQADLTAVVNYYPMRSYPFNLSMLRDKRLILASGVAPGSVFSRRLELSLEDTLLSRNLVSLKPIAEEPKIKPERRRAEAGVLLYLAKHAIEVDEPAGLWILSERGGVVPVSGLGKFSGQEIEGIDATRDGAAWVLQTSKQWVWLADKRKPRVFEKSNELLLSIGWNPTGKHFAAASGNGLRVWKRDGSEFALIPYPRGINQFRPAVGWEATGDAVILEVSEDYSSPLSLIRLDLSGHQTLLYKGAGKSSSHIDLTVIPLGPQEGTLFHSVNLGKMLVIHTGAQQWNESESPLSVSPSGNYRVFDGPRSNRREDNVHLLRLEKCNDQATQLPLVRFRGWIGNSIKWSLDESRMAFLVSREEAGHRRRINTLMYVRPGDRYAEAVSLPGQNPESFAWLERSLLETFLQTM